MAGRFARSGTALRVFNVIACFTAHRSARPFGDTIQLLTSRAAHQDDVVVHGHRAKCAQEVAVNDSLFANRGSIIAGASPCDIFRGIELSAHGHPYPDRASDALAGTKESWCRPRPRPRPVPT